MTTSLSRWVHRNFPRAAPPDSWQSLRSARVPPLHYLDKPLRLSLGATSLNPGSSSQCRKGSSSGRRLTLAFHPALPRAGQGPGVEPSGIATQTEQRARADKPPLRSTSEFCRSMNFAKAPTSTAPRLGSG
jgi:hypothetical protein